MVIFVMVKILPCFSPLIKRTFFGITNLLLKISWQDFFEANLRAATGKPLDRPYGANKGIFRWNKLQFNPSYLKKNPLHSDIEINTEIVLGPQAQKPLRLKIPILIGGMAYGSGYSLNTKIALAKAATLAGTATNSGNGPYLDEERRFAQRLILQYSRGFWAKSEKVLKQADMIEIALGHSSRGSAPVRITGKKITMEVAKRYGTIPGLDVLMEARLPEVEDMKQWKDLVQKIKEVTGGVPISVKFGASHYIEKEMELFIEGGVDVLAFDGVEGGTHGGMPVFMDDIGLPVFPALCRAVKFLSEHKLRHKISLVVGGGLVTPGDFAKCLALGADAVFIGTITALAQSHTQVTKTLPWEPPPVLIYSNGRKKTKYDPDTGAKNLHNYFQSCVREMEALARTLGKASLHALDRTDLVALDPVYAKIAEIDFMENP